MPIDLDEELLTYYIEVGVTADEHKAFGTTIGAECTYLIRDATKMIETKKVEAALPSFCIRSVSA